MKVATTNSRTTGHSSFPPQNLFKSKRSFVDIDGVPILVNR